MIGFVLGVGWCLTEFGGSRIVEGRTGLIVQIKNHSFVLKAVTLETPHAPRAPTHRLKVKSKTRLKTLVSKGVY